MWAGETSRCFSLKRVRLDQALIVKKLCRSIAEAQQAIDERQISVNGAIAVSHGFMVAPSDELLVMVREKYVSRGGFKLEAALKNFRINLADLRVLDVGASTGGFTDCALQHGARQVVALDVGKNLLHEKVRGDGRVFEVSETNVRDLTNLIVANQPVFGEKFDAVVADVSFISLHEIFTSILSVLKPDGFLVLLVKPQFEATRLEADKASGVIEDPEIHQRVCREIGEVTSQKGCSLLGIIESPIRGQQGNIEFLLAAKYTNPDART